MLVCDNCRDQGVRAFDLTLILTKMQQPSKQKRREARAKGEKAEPFPREVIRFPVALCDKCITKFLKNLGRLKVRGELSGPRKEVPSESV